MLLLSVLLLFGSGFAALVYQVLWVRQLGLVFGVTVYAASTVLAAFMGGLALGSHLAGRLADRVRSPLAWFAGAETFIGAAALATPFVLASLTPFYRWVSNAFPDNLAALTLARLVCSAAVLIVPTTMMGATVPFVLRFAVTRAGEVARGAAVLYAANTAGALTGALAAGYVLVGGVGMMRTLRVAASLNFLVALLALAIAHAARPGRLEAVDDEASLKARATSAAEPVTSAQRRVVLIVFAVSGFVSLALEVVWIRALLMFLPATTYVFTTILAVVLGGIAAGSAIAAAFGRRVPSLRAVAAIEAAIAVAAVLSLAALGWTYAAGWRTGAALQGAALAILPTTILMGLAFPLGLHYWAQGTTRVGARVGTFYALNVGGAVLGALTAGFVLIPALGTRASLVTLAGVTLLCALWLDAAAGGRSRTSRVIRGVALVLLFVAAARAVPDPLMAVMARRYPGERVLWREEGVQSTVSVHRQQDLRTVLYLDGLHQANDSPGMLATHRLIGTLAMALHPDPGDALVIGLGGGATAGAVARFANARVTIVELSPGVVSAARYFRHATGDVLNQPHVRLRVGDGRNHLLLTRDRFDVITADIIQPFHAGAGSLYSAEYFRLARAALRPNGLMLQWVGHRPRSQYLHIARTFLDVFPHTTAWAGGTLLVGTLQPLRLETERYRQRLTDPSFTGPLTSVAIAGFGGLVRQYTAGPDELRAFVGEGPVLTDDRPLVEYFMSLPKGEPDIDLTHLRGDVNRHIVQ